MGFFNRLSSGWKIGMTSFKVIRENKQLLAFPIISSIALIIVSASFLGGGFLLFGQDIDSFDGSITFEQGALLFIFYFVNYFIIIFFNMALIHCARLYFQGEQPSVSDGISFSQSRLSSIVGWAVFAATVGLILRAIENIHETVGAIVSSILGVMWGILTFFAVPVIAYENVGPLEAIKRSGNIIKNKWGESLGANLGINTVGFIAILIIALPLGLLFGALHLILGIVVGILTAVLIGVVMSAAQTIFVAAIYHHVTEEPVAVQPFKTDLLDDVFVKRKKSKWF
ncbi:MAG: DUF6159 family protein [Bacteroidia bacterium]